MKKKDYQMQYIDLKKQYDELLDKNQNDLIKIRIREKTLNDKILQIQNERQLQAQIMRELIQSMQIEIQGLKQQIKMQALLTTNNIQMIKNDHKVHLQNKLQQHDDKTKQEMERLKNQMIQCYKKVVQKQEEIIKLSNQLRKKQDQIQQKQSKYQNRQQQDKKIISQLMKQIQEYNNEYELNLQANNAYRVELHQRKEEIKVKNEEIKDLHHQINLLKTKLTSEQYNSLCLNCIKLTEQLQLQTQINKSVRTLLRFKEMEILKHKQ